MRRVGIAALSAVTVLVMSAGAAFAARPTITKVDFSQFEPFAEADWSAECTFPVDVEFKGHIIFREFDHGRLVEINTWHTFQSYSANGKTFVAPSTAGPDILWLAGDGTTYLAIAGRSPADGLIGRIVFNDETGDVASSNGRVIDNPFDGVCAVLSN
jgi:hypothetical protein